MQNAYKMLLEMPLMEDYEVLVEEANAGKPRNYYISGPYLMAEQANRNNRIYQLNEMEKEVERYTEELIKKNRSVGALNHPENQIDVDLEKACHMVVALEKKGGNYFYGKSKILNTPTGKIVQTLLGDGVKLGISSRALGRLVPKDGINMVEGFRLIAMDIVHEPSVTNAMLDSILENKEYLIDNSGRIMEVSLNDLQNRLKILPNQERNKYIIESFAKFIKSLRD